MSQIALPLRTRRHAPAGIRRIDLEGASGYALYALAARCGWRPPGGLQPGGLEGAYYVDGARLKHERWWREPAIGFLLGGGTP